MSRWARPKAWFMIFRIQAVVIWSVATSTMGTAWAYRWTGEIDGINFLLCLAISSIVQGFPAHIVNEITDWKSGADRPRAGKSGGGKVLLTGLATVPQLRWMFWMTSAAVFVLAGWLCIRTAWMLGALFIAGYTASLLYTLPPFRFAYRPFLGEWLGGFVGIVMNLTGSYAAQTGRVDARVIDLAVPVGLIYIGIMLLFHYIDYRSDQLSRPVKRTTIVHLGLRRSRMYVGAILLIALVLSVVESFSAWQVLWLAGWALAHLVIHGMCRPESEDSVLHAGKWLMLSTVFGVTGFAASIHPLFLLFVPITWVARRLHKTFGKLPSEWRSVQSAA